MPSTAFRGPQSTRARPMLQHALVDSNGLANAAYATHLTQVADVVCDGPVIYDTHAARINTNPQSLPYYGVGRYLRYLFVETDRNFAVYLAMVDTSTVTPPAWQLLFGQMLGATLSALPIDLTGYDVGMLFFDHLLQHNYRWNGAGWNFAPGDPGAGFIVASLMGGPPDGGAWQLCDGTGPVTVSVGDGTTTNITTPAMCTASPGIYMLAAQNPPGSGLVTKTSPSYSSNPVTTGNDSGSATVQSGAGATVANHPHTHSVTLPAINAPSPANGGLPNYIALPWYLRL